MKKLIITMTMIITFITSAVAGDEKIRNEVQKAFTSRFSGAKHVTWKNGIDYYKATFNYNDNWMYVYYSKDAELMAEGRNLLFTQLPFYLQNNLKSRYSDYWITELFELSNDDGFRYYITLQNAEHSIILKSSNGGSWTVVN